MSDDVCSSELLIQNKKGLHARAAASFVKCVEEFDAEVTVERLGQAVNGCSIMGLMMLGAACEAEIKIVCSGTDARKALDALEKLINDKFNEN